MFGKLINLWVAGGGSPFGIFFERMTSADQPLAISYQPLAISTINYQLSTINQQLSTFNFEL
jgi:hypothetical protein